MGDSYGYKQARDKFMHSNGTTALETFLVILPSFAHTVLSTILLSLIGTFYTKNVAVQFCVEFACIVFPTILQMTILSQYTVELLLYSLILAVTLMYLIYNFKAPVQAPHSTSSSKNVSCITNARSLINFMTVIAILAVDFRVFPRKFAKTEHTGYSLMDVGVGLFVFANGIVDSGRTNLLKTLKGCVPLIVLGLGRLFIVKQIDYHVPVTEYGVHWNFFITLLVCKIFCSLLFSIIDIRYIWINATLLMISHQTLLQLGLGQFVTSNIKRTTFLTANREGIVSSVGYVCVYLFSAYSGYFLDLKNPSAKRTKTIVAFSFLAMLTIIVTFSSEAMFGISRKLVNVAYCSWILFIGIFMTMLFYIFEQLRMCWINEKLSFWHRTPVIFEAINYNGLLFFLSSNVLTGLVNMACDSLNISSAMSLVIISIYMLLNCGLVFVLYQKKKQFKL